MDTQPCLVEMDGEMEVLLNIIEKLREDAFTFMLEDYVCFPALEIEDMDKNVLVSKLKLH